MLTRGKKILNLLKTSEKESDCKIQGNNGDPYEFKEDTTSVISETEYICSSNNSDQDLKIFKSEIRLISKFKKQKHSEQVPLEMKFPEKVYSYLQSMENNALDQKLSNTYLLEDKFETNKFCNVNKEYPENYFFNSCIRKSDSTGSLEIFEQPKLEFCLQPWEPNQNLFQDDCQTETIDKNSGFELSDSEYIPTSSFETNSEEYSNNNGSVIQQNLKPEKQKSERGPINNLVVKTELKLGGIPEGNKTTESQKNLCPFCFDEVDNHFARHLFTYHSDEETVKKILSMPVKSRDRRSAIVLLRRKGNFILQTEKNIMKPVRKSSNNNDENFRKNYSTCINCFGLIKNSYLWKHRKMCTSNAENSNGKRKRVNHVSESQTFLVCTGHLGNFLQKSRIMEVFKIMRGDDIGFAARNDSLICLYGESLMGKHKRQQMKISVSQKMRQMGKLKIALQKSTTISTLMDALKPEMYEHFIAATKLIAGYDNKEISFKAASLANNMGTNLKFLCETAKKAIITKNPLINLNNRHEKLTEITELRQVISSHWCNDIASLALKVLNERKYNKPKLLPLTEDVRAFNNYASVLANQAYNDLTNGENCVKNYQILAQCTLALLLIFNRKRIGEIQFLDIDTYNRDFAAKNQEEILSCLSEFEKSMSNSFKRVVVFGKGSKPVPILFTQKLQKFTELLIKIRTTSDIVPKTNKYIFANPGSDRWMNGSYIVRTLASKCGAKQPELLSSTRFRKQIATILQLMSLEKDEMHQIAKFMGHTEKTHMDFYRLTEDVYQTAKVAKVLLLLNSGRGNEFKGKSLNEIDIEEELSYNYNHLEEPDNCELSQEPETSTKNVGPIPQPIKGRIRWGSKQKETALKFFKSHIDKSIPPKKNECLEFIHKNPKHFKENDWVRIKALIFNTYRNKKL